MRVAKQLFFAKGYVGTPLRTIANKAGTSESGVLRIFESKSGLLRAVYASCWAEINARIDQALAAAEADDPDPRNLLLRLMQTVFETYDADPPMMNFMLSYFGFNETTGLSQDEGVDPAIDSQVRQEYHRYLGRIHGLCDEAAKSRPTFARTGVTSAALGHIFTSMIYGIQAGWYMAAQEPDTPTPQVTAKEALKAAELFMYPEKWQGGRP
jgi:AcrR family transcriptional regulator